jgi:hypothetical protein
VRVVAGRPATFSVTVGSRNGYAGDVALSLAGLAAGQATWSFSPPTVHGSGTAQLSIATASSLAPGTYSLRITGSDGTLARTAAVTLEVSGPPDFTLTTTPASAVVRPGQSATFSVTAAAQNGFAGPVALSATGIPNSTRATFTPTPLAAPGTSSLTLATGTGTRRATYTITVVGTSGALRHTTPITLTVR